MECLAHLSTSYGDFSRRVHEKMGERRLPLEGSIEITERCNLQCVHCYINRPPGDREAQNQELSYDEICGIIDQIVQEGCLWLLFTGGEPYLRPDFPEIYMYAKRNGLLITLFTNGTLLTPEIVDQLAEYPPFSVEISLYGYSAETYERVTGVPGSHSRCLRGIELLREKGLPLKLKTPLMKSNHHEFDEIKEFANKLGVNFCYDVELNLRVDEDDKPALERLRPEQVIKLDFADEKRQKEWQEFAERYVTSILPSDQLYQCGAGIGRFHVSARGQLTSCLMARKPSYNLRYGSFVEGWTEFIPKMLDQAWTKQSTCKDCKLKALCSWCPGWAQMEHGDQEAPIEYLCHITRLRSKMLEKCI